MLQALRQGAAKAADGKKIRWAARPVGVRVPPPAPFLADIVYAGNRYCNAVRDRAVDRWGLADKENAVLAVDEMVSTLLTNGERR